MHIYFKIKHTQQAHGPYFGNPLHKLTFTLQMIIITYLWEPCIPLHEGYKDLQANIRNLFPSIPNEFPPSDKRPPKKPGKRKKALENVREVGPQFSLSHPPTNICWYTHPCSNLLLSFTILWLFGEKKKKKEQQSVNKKPGNRAKSGAEVNQHTPRWCWWNYKRLCRLRV